MAKIVIDAREYATSTGRYIFRLVQQLEQIDRENNYVILLRPSDIDAYVPANPNFSKQVTPYKEFSFGEQLGFARQLKKLKADLVHFGMTQQPLLYGHRAVTTIHDLTTARYYNPAKNRLVFTLKQQVYRFLIRRVARRAATLITPSGYVKDDVAAFAGINPDKITVTPEAADAITATAEPVEELAGKQFLFYVGRPTPHKNLERLVEAFALLRAQRPDLFLVLAGKNDANYRRMEELVKKRGIENVVFSGFVSESQLRWLYEQCAAYVFPSLSEGFGLPGLEAMAHGAPVVSSSTTCLPEVYGDAARYFDPLDVQSMSDAINEVLTNADLRQALIEKGQKQVQKYSWRRMAEQTLAVYSGVLRS